VQSVANVFQWTTGCNKRTDHGTQEASSVRCWSERLCSQTLQDAGTLARIRVLLRRFGHRPANIVDTQSLCINLEARLVTVRGKRVNLAPKEFEALKVLVLARG
jgi:hypothetical protein